MAAKPKYPLVLIDGSSYLYRAFHALPPLTNSQGQQTGAVFGVINMLRKLIEEYNPEYIGVIFDPKGKTFRNDMYAEYKANRPPMPDELRSQIQPIFDIVKAMGYPLVVVDGFEADDVIGTLARQAAKKNINTLISTGDKDLAQLVNKHITLINTMNDTLFDKKGVVNKFGIPPELIIDYLTLIGDTSDNIPGVPKVGPKTAVKWLTQYGSLDEIVSHADEFPGKVGEYLREFLDQLPLSRELVTIKDDVKLDVKYNQLAQQEPNNEKLVELFRDLEFKSWLSKTLDKAEPTSNKPKKYVTITSEKDLASWMDKIKKADLFAFDTETTSLNYMDAEMVGLSISVKPDEAAYIPFGHDYEDAPKQLSRDTVLSTIKPILEDSKQHKLGHHIKYDMHVLENHGIELKGIQHDSMLESYIVQSAGVNHGLDALSLKYLGVKTVHFEEIAGKGKKQLTFNQIPLDIASNYAAEDADITLQLHNTLWPKLNKVKGLKDIYENIEIPLLSVLARMEHHGVLIDVKKLNAQSKSLEKRIAELQTKLFKMAKCEFNLDSPKQLQEILFEKLNLPIIKKTPKGQPSTAEPVLQELALDYPMPKLILEYRSLSKLKSTYTDRLPEQINAKTKRVHTSYNQSVTTTGRLASSDPNLQNIPIRTDEGRKVRKAFIAPKGYKIIALDYSQIELRIMAHISKDKNLIKAFKNGWDIHKATAAEIMGLPLEKVTTAQRRSAKVINFGLIYGMSAFGLAKQLGVRRNEAQEYIDIYFQRYPKVHDYMDKIKETARKQGYVETIQGRRLYLPEIKSSNFQRRQAAERAAINAPMQGTAADIIKVAMIEIDKFLQKSPIDAHMIMQVHDELVFEVLEKDAAKLKKELINLMENTTKLDVKLVVAAGVGNNWDEAH